MKVVTRLIFGLLSLSLAVAAAGLAVYGFVEVAQAFRRGEPVQRALLDLVGYLVVAVATFDVAKYLFEDEVQRAHVDRRAPGEARRSVTRIVSTVAIAVLLEGLVGLFRAGHENPSDSVFGVYVLLAGVALLLGLGVYLRLSASTEAEVGQDEDLEAQEERDAA